MVPCCSLQLKHDKFENPEPQKLVGISISGGRKFYYRTNYCCFQGDRIGVNLVDNRAGVVVGTAARDSEDMYMSAGRGKAVIVLHCVGDKLWESGSKEAVPQLGPVEGLSPDQENEEKEAEDDDAASTGKEDASEDNDDEENDLVDEVRLYFWTPGSEPTL